MGARPPATPSYIHKLPKIPGASNMPKAYRPACRPGGLPMADKRWPRPAKAFVELAQPAWPVGLHVAYRLVLLAGSAVRITFCFLKKKTPRGLRLSALVPGGKFGQ